MALLMGLNLLEVLPLRFPSLDVDVRSLGLPPMALAYAAGLTFALAASPCSTPILASILAYVSTQNAPATGASLLFTYSLGYIAPVIAAATATVRCLTPLARLLSCLRRDAKCAACKCVVTLPDLHLQLCQLSRSCLL